MVLSDEYYDYEKSIVQTDPETGKLSLNHIPVGDPRLDKLQELAMGKKDIDSLRKRNGKNKTVNIINRGKKFYDFEDVDWIMIKMKRKSMNLTQCELASNAGVSQSVYQQYENGKIRISKKRLTDICNVLGLKIRERIGNQSRIDISSLQLIKKKRLGKGYNQYVFADLIGTSQGNYSGCETGKIPFNERVLKETCKVLEIDYEDVTMNAR